MNSQKLISQILGFWLSISLTNIVHADDIEVYGVYAGAEAAPNVLFIIDISGSMREGTDGLMPASGEKSKKQILNEVFSEVIAGSAGKINAGLVFFNGKTSGIKWPISNLTGLASTIDSNLPVDMTNKDVLDSLVSNSGESYKTNYVSPLTEAVQYFSGDKVWFNGETQASSLIPPEWESTNNRYSLYWPQASTPIPGSYMPQDAFKAGNVGTDPATKSCWDGQIFDPTAANDCADKELVPGSCVVKPETTYNYTTCSVPEVCDEYDEGGCMKWECPGTYVTQTGTSDGHQRCDYYVGSWEAPNYVSPIGSTCQENYIILLSDGLPTVNDNPSKALEILGLPVIDSCDNMGSMFFGDSSYNYGDCAAELVEHMATTDMVSGVSPSTVKTYTIGFGLTGDSGIKGSNYLTHLATKGGGEFFAATSYDGLVTSLNSILDNIAGEVVDDFTGISVGVRNSSFSNDNRAFLNIFKPSARRSWSGNMKGYFLGSDGLLDLSGKQVIDTDGSIKEGTQSFWSKSPDGAFVTKGGLSETIKSGSRNLYTYTGLTSPTNINLNSSGGEHLLETSNPLLTNTMLGVVDDTNRTEVLDWVETAPISAPLHTKPVIAKYSTGEVVFTMTNQGFIHAVDAEKPRVLKDKSGGDELFAFIPTELLPNLQQIKTNLSTGQHIYGLDGQITFHHNDDNKDGVINSGETARLYFGMRRGGNNYYALDISNKTSPKLLWQIKGGEGQFSEMGQSWSRMVLTTLKSGSTKDVLIFGGGYDESEDAKTSRSAGKGNRVYIVDASTGEHLWSTGSGASGLNAGEMIYSIPTDISAIDFNGNGYTDHLYFGDMGGQLWRVKFEETLDGNGVPTNNFTSNASVERIGDFGSSANRKFFYPPSVALMNNKGKNYLAITIGSGNRAHPLKESVQDMIFMVRDPLETPVMTTLQLSDLYDATDNLVGQGSDKAAERALMSAADGWYMKLGPGEKSLSKLVAYDRKLRFTTYQPTAVVTQACSASSSSKGRYYVMKLGDGTPGSDKVVDESTLTKDDRAIDISVQGIPSEPNIIFPPDGSTVEVFVGKEKISTVVQNVKQLYWKQIH